MVSTVCVNEYSMVKSVRDVHITWQLSADFYK